MNFDKLSYFVRVVEKGGITKAAISLNMTQPPLSKAIKDLEEELESNLFIRKGKRLELTETGKYLYEKGKKLITYSSKMKDDIRVLDGKKERVINVGCSNVAAITVVPKIIKKVREKNLKLKVNVVEGPTSYLLEQLRYNKLDIVIARNILDSDDNFDITVLYTEPIHIVLPKKHELASKNFLEIMDLKDEKFILPLSTTGYGLSEYIIDGCQASGFTPEISYWGGQSLPMIELVKEGMGIAFVPASYENIISMKKIEMIPLKSNLVHARCYAIKLKMEIFSKSTELFMNLINEVIYESDL